jgi:di/tricarboxylate transporter
MLFVLGLLPLEEVCMITGAVAVLVWWILVAMPLGTFLLLVYKACVLGLMCVTVMSFIPLYGSLQRTAHSHDVDEAWDEVQDLSVVGEREVVGEPRRAQHALVAQVDLGSLGKLTLTLEPTPVHR